MLTLSSNAMSMHTSRAEVIYTTTLRSKALPRARRRLEESALPGAMSAPRTIGDSRRGGGHSVRSSCRRRLRSRRSIELLPGRPYVHFAPRQARHPVAGRSAVTARTPGR